MNKTRGFTLIELMVVLFIMGLIASVGTPLMDLLGGHSLLKKESEKLFSSLQLAQKESVIGFEIIGLVIHQQGYRFMRYQPDQKIWSSMNRIPVYAPVIFPPGIRPALEDKTVGMRLALFPDNPNLIPQIVFGPRGALTPFFLDIHDQTTNKSIELIGLSNGQIHYAAS